MRKYQADWKHSAGYKLSEIGAACACISACIWVCRQDTNDNNKSNNKNKEQESPGVRGRAPPLQRWSPEALLPRMPASLLPSPTPGLPTCYMLSITGQHQSTPHAYTPDYCRYGFLNRKIYTLNIAVNTGKSIGMSELLLLLGLRASSRRTVYACSLNAVGD